MPMRIVRLLFIFLFTATLFAQNYTQKYSASLKNELSRTSDDGSVLVWIFFKDKGLSLNKYFESPSNVVSEKSLLRREKVLPKSELIDFTDLPVNRNYINQLEAMNVNVKQITKWFNGVSAFVKKSELPKISGMNFVKKIDVVAVYKGPRQPEMDEQQPPDYDIKKVGNHIYNYGNSLAELEQINVPAAHDSGYTGAGVTIALMDAGVSNFSHEVFTRMINNNQIIAKYDFVNHDYNIANQPLPDSGDGSHGTWTLALIGGFKEGQLIGPAFDSKFILAKTENTQSESSIEEDNWVAAMEWADSIGVDITSTSLGYRGGFTSGTGYTAADMNGHTTIITLGAEMAVRKGIVVVNSAGNERGNHTEQNTLVAPADGDSVIAVGAVFIYSDTKNNTYTAGDIAPFSSYGPTADNRTKPDVVAGGVSNYIPSATPGNISDYGNGNGTSFSCPLVAGVAALVLQAHPLWTPMQVRDALRETASRHNSPDNDYGWGIIDAMAAIHYGEATKVEAPALIAPVNGSTNQPVNITLKWNKITNASKYHLQVSKDSLFSNFVYDDSTISDTTQQLISLSDGTKYFWRIGAMGSSGSSSFSNTWKFTTTGSNNQQTIPDTYVLEQNYPNPFNPSTMITYKIPDGGFVSMKVYNLLGNLVTTLVNENKPAGTYTVEFDAKKRANPLPSGVYFYRLQVGNFVSTKKMVVMK